MAHHPVTPLAQIQGEYLESAGLRLTVEQAQRLWGLDHTQCTALFQALVDSGFLRQANDGAYVRSIDSRQTLA